MTDEQSIADKLETALREDKFILYRQLIRPIGPAMEDSGLQEVLIRFREEEEKLLHPGAFFSILESLKLMPALDRWVVKRVIGWILDKHRVQKNWGVPRCSINLSAESICNIGFPKFVRGHLEMSNIPPDKLLFEIPEPDAEAHAVALKALIGELKPLGCNFALAGYNGTFVSAESLQARDISFVKIDGHIVNTIHRDSVSFGKASSINLACQKTGVRTIAELVELPETLEKLKELGVNYAQGYGVAKPEPLN